MRKTFILCMVVYVCNISICFNKEFLISRVGNRIFNILKFIVYNKNY